MTTDDCFSRVPHTDVPRAADVPILDSRGPDPHAPADDVTVDLVLDGDHAVGWVTGDVDFLTSPHLVDLGALALADSRVDELVIDLSRVTSFSAAGLDALLQLKDQAAAADKNCALRGIPIFVSKVLAVTDLGHVFGLTGSDAGRC